MDEHHLPQTPTKDSQHDDDDRLLGELVTDPEQLARYGVVCHIPLPRTVDWQHWANELSQATLDNLAFEGDGQYAFYRNILEEPDFPFDSILSPQSDICQAVVRHFGIGAWDDEVRLDDAFCVHYNMEQDDTTGAKHMDPSDITINLCLAKSADCRGSHVLFHGTRALHNSSAAADPTLARDSRVIDDGDDDDDDRSEEDVIGFRFRVNQEPGYATIHWGDHPHETTRLESGERTNIVLTLCYKDEEKSQANKRACYF